MKEVDKDESPAPLDRPRHRWRRIVGLAAILLAVLLEKAALVVGGRPGVAAFHGLIRPLEIKAAPQQVGGNKGAGAAMAHAAVDQ
ncbi:MAG: hypothetical protein EOM24_30835, partial [Chloroflexia bacterium]|nr:hypothetical protein [Chloroflexia bacterium]